MMHFQCTTQLGRGVKSIGKTCAGMSIKCGCQWLFMTKHPYLDGSLCQFLYKHIEHANKSGEHCHGSMVADFRLAFDSNCLRRWSYLFNKCMHTVFHWLRSCLNTSKRLEIWQCATNPWPVTYFCCCPTFATYVASKWRSCGRNMRQTP